MLRFSSKGRKWLKGFHLLAASCWVGGAVALVMLYFLKGDVNDGGVLYGINQSIHHLDITVVIIPGAIGCLLTGLLYSLFTNWGFFKHKWIIVKWIVTVAAILFGTFFLGPWETLMMELSGKLGMSALSDVDYLYNQRMQFVWGAIQTLILIVTIFISILKPWKSSKPKASAENS